jgi:NADH-quinone oxidoreductase subunit C
MQANSIIRRIEDTLGITGLVWTDAPQGDPFLVVPAEKLRAVVQFLKEDPPSSFDTLMSLSGVHQLGEPELLEVVYHLFSIRHGHRLVLKVRLDRPLALPHFYLRLDSVSGVWPGAGWLEREVYDMFGVHFVGHKDFRRLLLPPDWQGYPLLKDYQEPPAYRSISTVREKPAATEIAPDDPRISANVPERSAGKS